MRVARFALLALAGGCVSVQPAPEPPCPVRIRFAGIDWSVSDAAERFPGAARRFKWNACNVKVEPISGGGELLTLVLHKTRDGWRGAQIESEAAYQYGAFSMTIETPLSPMLSASPSAVLGFFAYVGPAYSSEIDIELTRWGSPSIPPLHYTVWHNVTGGTPPPDATFATGADSDFTSPTRHRFVWTDRAVTFESRVAASSALVGRPFTVRPSVPTKAMHILLNLWVEREANMGAATEYAVKITSVVHPAP